MGGLTVPLVPELDLILQPFSLLETVESEKVIPETTLLLFPPTDPILKPLQMSVCAPIWELIANTHCPPEQVIPVMVTFFPLVTATQSS